MQAATTTDPIHIDCAHHYKLPVDRSNEVAQLAIFLGVVSHVVMGVSRRATDFLMGVLFIIMSLCSKKGDGSHNPSHSNILSQIPILIEDALSRFKLEGCTTTFAVCPSCHSTYAPQFATGGTFPIYPQWCTNIPNPESAICNEPLLKSEVFGNTPKILPIRTFVYHHFTDYLAGLLSQHETVMDNACLNRQASINERQPTYIKGVFDAQFLRTFEGPVSGQLFIDGGTEGRYLFVINIDFFNAEGMCICGTSASSGLISAACINLPEDIHDKPENMYCAGIISGPKEPTLEFLNPYLKPVIDDMVIAWERGYHFSRTPSSLQGQTSRCAVAAMVADLVAARKTAQLGPGTHTIFCVACKCTHRSSLGRVDCDAWEKRSGAELRTIANQWKTASTTKERSEIYKAHGVHWSELW
ncbi:hypothetical protein K439DRAFT_1624914 [Ramaria rubella]|nr:hypothetical protein K439DRAFT_1624914 [Ramaria rubella]